MDLDDLLPRRKDDPLAALARQDLTPLSVEELDERVELLAAEIERTRTHRSTAVNNRASADALFRKG